MADTLSKLAKPAGSTKKKTRRGRGPGSGLGKTAGRGQKGQYARRATFKPSFEGGQTPLARRLPKRGFKKHNRAVIGEINVGQLDGFESGANVDERALRDHGLLKGHVDRIKILGTGELSKKITVTAHSFSKAAQAKIAKAGGKAVLVVQAQAAAAAP
jgi:large subunit ribosomal protein L15